MYAKHTFVFVPLMLVVIIVVLCVNKIEICVNYCFCGDTSAVGIYALGPSVCVSVCRLKVGGVK